VTSLAAGELSAQIEALLDELDGAGPAVAGRAEELVRAVVGLHGAGLRRLVELLRGLPDGERIMRLLAADDIVAGLLLLHELHPGDATTRRQQDVDQVAADHAPQRPRELPLLQIQPLPKRSEGPPKGGTHGARERCGLCGEQVAAEHGHVANLGDRRLLCACRACYLLFAEEGAGNGRYRAVPQRYLRLPRFAFSQAQWDSLNIPVDLAFFFHQSDLDTVVACYPSPAGATESLLDLSAWANVVAANPVLAEIAADVEADVEALLLRWRATDPECYLVPIDACYELAGLVRAHWVGLNGGAELWRRIDEYFDQLRRRCAQPGPEGPGG
jgi:Family of unknown function (DUF5947)